MGLFLLSVETGEKPRITLPPNEDDDVDAAFSPDMRHLVFAPYTGAAGASSDLYALNLSRDLQPEGPPPTAYVLQPPGDLETLKVLESSV
jgi:hypothetical protein